MGLTELKISFKEEKRRALEGASTSVALLILKDSTVKGLKEYVSFDQVTEKYKSDNLMYIEHAFKGNIQDVRVGGVLEERAYTPSKVIVYSIGSDDTLDNALEVLENVEFNYMCMPDATDEVENPKLIAFINKLKEIGHWADVVIATNNPSNSSSVIEFATDNIKEGSVTYTANKLLPFIVGACAGTPFTQSITYCNVPFITNIPKKTNEELNSLINAGKLVLVKKGGKVRIARGVTSLTGVDGNEGETFKKIKLVRTYKMINNAVKKSITDFYVGKVSNSYDNKCLLISEIKGFLEDLNRSEMIANGFSVNIDMEAQKKYLIEKGVDVKSLSEQELKEFNTGSKVFIVITLKGVDAMEDFYININV
ncbi:phage tail sheath C-terminal domain-containing protein [Peptostreptococcus sp. D1]|uniref:phage tail sheath C-terminal domain-containing protein n=1 Tax=Peptostreptococcus sp. D1 TaxID=72304 RepID=UPI0008EE3C41|nr:phage tail sheath C-terminal domain-containing protein [Peptostreptococcus sp. D1]SFE38138.1 Phage tail sheath protein [Peptostreptococcus sp. D1]